MSIEDEPNVIVIGSILESTPEGLYLMDKIQRDVDAERAAMEPWEREVLDELNKRIYKEVLGL